MRRIRDISAILAAMLLTLLLQGCGRGSKMDPQLYEGDSICLKIKDNVIFTMDPQKGQTGFRRSEGEFRASDDAMNEYFVICCDPFPSKEGMTVNAYMEWTWRGNVQKRDGIRFKVEKIDDASSLIWLWSSKDKVGAVVKMLD
jgi:hypothetical protein